jgi:hypothetical protein
MAEEEKGAKWWFRYVIVPIIGGGGAIAIITALIEHPPERPPAITEQYSQKPPSDDRSPKPSFKFTIAYDPKLVKSISPDMAYFMISVYVDDRAVVTIEGDGSGGSQAKGVTVATLGNHHYNLLGIIVTGPVSVHDNSIEAGQIKVKGEGTIYVQEGSEFTVNVDRSHGKTNPRNIEHTSEATMRLERTF